ncbi:MAG: precorrin-4 C(11)-methyltransferase [Deltaproteobacteria bacterium CG_4_10_14_3_um_filter_60_8]|nr:MAG: precorrin-4 C(11)-methyltransferase [Desulfobacterales bacterium CG2_30_60_27]PIP43555.1 MAG: precorrin-4 C(11)-methyltransferase [Deltaproteobacteria bacterium CG23_combo_of_CG06-09_8_20_14_all_60_8]PIY24842.1 MAG: precorrin-4 C(11)-methyltransferase [Deltaproteobacteria bacterium CG_4_10_14_3_um_filter_60_8]
MSEMPAANSIHFVGAGPGDPELITVKGWRLLREADLVIYAGSLVPRALVADLAAEVHDSAPLHLDEIISLMATAWQAGKKVVRLHTGDPAIYGAIKEQMRELDKQTIPYRVVPGVSSATATAAALQVELTLPEVSQTVIITRRAGRTPVPAGQDLASLAAHQATMLILLSVGMIDQVVEDLRQGGYPADTPVAVVEKVSWPEERIVTGTLADIAATVKGAGITKTAIIAVGKVFGQGDLEAVSRLYDKDFAHGYRQT